MKKKHKKKKLLVVLLLLTLLISVGYALLSADVDIIGRSTIKSATWDIHLENLRVSSGSVDPVTAPMIEMDNKTVSYSANLNTPGDYYEFSVDVKNGGTIDGMVSEIVSQMKIDDGEFTNVSPSRIPRYLTYTVTESDGSSIIERRALDAGSKRTYKVRIEYKKDIREEDLPTTDKNLQFKFIVNYVQKDNTSIA